MDTPTGKAVDQAHAELLKFVGKAGLLLDYVGEIPTARDCAECRPNAKGWWTPIENGPMFTGPWLAAVCRRAEASGLDADRALARRLAGGLLRAASLSETPGFIARGEGADPGSHYPIGSMDQTLPWFYGLYAYQKSPVADPEVADNARKTMLAVADAIAKNGWKCPCEAPFDAETCGNFLNESAPFRVDLGTDTTRGVCPQKLAHGVCPQKRGVCPQKRGVCPQKLTLERIRTIDKTMCFCYAICAHNLGPHT